MGTERENRISGCRLPSDAEMKKNGRGSHVERHATIEGVKVKSSEVIRQPGSRYSRHIWECRAPGKLPAIPPQE